MATTLSFLVFTAAVLLGAIFAFVLLQYAFGRLSGKAASSIRLGSRIGVLALLLPSVWFAVFLGAPLGGGFAIGVLGEPAMQVGLLWQRPRRYRWRHVRGRHALHPQFICCDLTICCSGRLRRPLSADVSPHENTATPSCRNSVAVPRV
jgi:hypothetical protein